MLESRTLMGDDLRRFKEIILHYEKPPYGIAQKFHKFFDGASSVDFVFNEHESYAVAIKASQDNYELNFNARGYAELAMIFAAALQKLDSERNR